MRRALLLVSLFALALPLSAAADPPVITVPPDLTVEAQNFSGAAVSYTASAVDDHGRPITVTCAPPSGSVFGFGTTTVTCSARSDGQTKTKSFKVTVVDTQPPAITVPAPIQVKSTVRSGKIVAFNASAADIVDGAVTPTCAPASDTRFPIGATTVTCSASDLRGNRSAASFTVTVALKRSTQSSAMVAPRAGARVSAPPMLRWRAPRKAAFFNVQLYRRGHKVLSVWPTHARFRMQGKWTFHGRSYRLKPGSYTWLVWPAFGSQANPRYGKLLGQSTFVFSR